MSKSAQSYLLHEIRKAIEYCAREYDMTWAEAVGCLHMAIQYYTSVAFETEEDDEDDEDELSI